MHNLYLFAACFLPLITFSAAPNNFQVGANLTSEIPSSVDQPLPNTDHQLGNLSARDVSQYTNDNDTFISLEKRQTQTTLLQQPTSVPQITPSELDVTPYTRIHPYNAVGMVGPNWAGTVVAEEGNYIYVATGANCVFTRDKQKNSKRIDDLHFTVIRRAEGSPNIHTESASITNAIILDPNWLEQPRAYNNLAVIKVGAGLSHGKIDMTTFTSQVGDQVIILSVREGNMLQFHGSITKVETTTHIVEVPQSANILIGSPVQSDTKTICGVVSKRKSPGLYHIAPITRDKIMATYDFVGPRVTGP